MFKQIENLYKKEDPNNRIKNRMFILYIIDVIILWVSNVNNLYILMIATIIISFFAIKHICEKQLNTKLHFRIKEKNGQTLNEIIHDKEKQLFLDFLKNEKIYNKDNLECIISHYRSYIKPITIENNLWTIIAIVLSIVLAFVTKDGFNINSFEKSLPYLISAIFITLIIYFIIKRFTEIRLFFKGEDSMYDNLEGIFSELYIEFDSNNITQKTVKKSNKKRKKKAVNKQQ